MRWRPVLPSFRNFFRVLLLYGVPPSPPAEFKQAFKLVSALQSLHGPRLNLIKQLFNRPEINLLSLIANTAFRSFCKTPCNERLSHSADLATEKTWV